MSKIVKCKGCQKEFEIFNCRINPKGNYCSLKCRSTLKTAKCKYCNKEFKLYKRKILSTGNFCSKSCNKRFHGNPYKIISISQEEYLKVNINISLDEFNKLKLTDKVALTCKLCKKEFIREKEVIIHTIKNHKNCGYCSTSCHNKSKINKIKTKCKTCDKDIIVRYQSWKNNKDNNCFCSYTCSAIFRNKNKTSGYKRSKMEIYIEEKLNKAFPNCKIICNETKILDGLELDFYIPEFNLAFELNGITHYKPIYGQERFERSLYSDKRKAELCKEKQICLNIIDISMYKYFTKISGDKVFDEITKTLSPLYNSLTKNLSK